MKNVFYNLDMENIPSDKEVIFLAWVFLGSRKTFLENKGVYVTSVGYSSGKKINPTYEEVCSGNTNHAEVVKVAYDLKIINTFDLLVHFWEGPIQLKA